MKTNALHKPHRVRIQRILVLFCLGMSAAGMGTSHAGWLVDAKGYHISAHGQLSCQDCHGDMADEPIHPDPGQVNQNLPDLFSPEDCLVCHDDIQGGLEQGLHGSLSVTDPETYLRCLECHHPHYQERLGKDRMGQFAPDTPRIQQCGACHKPYDELPPFSTEDEACMSCHRAPQPDDPTAASRTARFCFHCHATGDGPAQVLTGKRVSLIDPDAYTSTPHAEVACGECHLEAAQYPHSQQQLGPCTACHVPHDEKVNHAAHLGVTCGACHLEGIEPVRDSASGRVVWTRQRKPEETSTIHQMALPEEDSCRVCHVAGNDLGAASVVLPPKSILCMPCHASTVSVGDTVTLLSLMVFLAGIIGITTLWLSGSVSRSPSTGSIPKRHLFSAKIPPIAGAVFWDGFLQRRLFRLSKGRWLIHGLIFWPFAIRFVWGIIGLLGSLWKPQWGAVWTLLDKNAPVTAFLFDLTGIMLILGLFFAWIRGVAARRRRPAGLPKQDSVALALIGAIVGVGFVLEGMRIAMTGSPPGSEFAFLGYALSRSLVGISWLTEAYGYVWYVHAVLTGIFIAYLPFSRLFHIVTAPIVLAMNAAEGTEPRKTPVS